MKKIISIGILFLLLASLCTTVAYAEITPELYVKNTACKNEKVVDCECVIYKRACLVALQTEKFTTKSEYDAFIDELTAQIKENCEVDNVFVTRSPKVMHKLKELNKLDDKAKTKTIEDLINRELNRGIPHKLPPKMLTVTFS